MMLFELKSVTPHHDRENILAAKSAAKTEAFERLQCAKVNIIEEHLQIPGPQEAIFAYTANQFNTMAFIVWLIKHLGRIEELTISTYSIGEIAINTLIKWFDTGKIGDAFFYAASYAKRIATKTVDSLMAQCDARGIRVRFGFNHSKILLAKSGDYHIVITGSGNFSENAANEQYTICNDREVYYFYRSCIREDHPDR